MRGEEVLSAESNVHATQRSDAALDSHAGAPRAIFVLNSLNIGGSEMKVVRLVNALRRRGLPAGIAYLKESRELLSSIDPGVPVWHLERRGKFSAGAVAKLRRILRDTRPSAVFAVNLYPVLYVSLAAAGLSPSPRTIGLLNTTAPVKRDEWRRSFYRPFLRRLDAVVFGCDVQRGEWRPYVSSARARSTVIYNGVDTNHFRPSDEQERAQERRRRRIGAESFVVGTVGRLAVEKNQRVLVEAVAKLRANGIDAHLVLVGDGAARADLERLAAELGLSEHATFAGVASDVRPWLTIMDVFVLPSTNVETFSNAALEAMAMQKPVILSRLGGASEMIRDGVDGYVVDLDALSGTILSLLTRLQEDRALRERLARSARQRVVRCFSMEAMIERFSELIDSKMNTVGAN